MKTVQTYLCEPDLLRMNVNVLAVTDTNVGRLKIVTDLTPFYVQGGGQPSDTGRLVARSDALEITGVFRENETIAHEILGNVRDLSVGETIFVEVDSERRTLHCRLHTAGELICAAAKTVKPQWTPISAIHFPSNASVSFRPDAGSYSADEVAFNLEEQINDQVRSDFSVKILDNISRRTAEQMVGYSLDNILPESVIRLVNPCPEFYRACMGTHVQQLSAIGRVKIRKVKSRKGLVVVGYDVESTVTLDAA